MATEESSADNVQEGSFEHELRGIRQLHAKLGARMARIAEDLVAFPSTQWSVLEVDVEPLHAVVQQLPQQSLWGLLRFRDQPHAALVWLDARSAAALASQTSEVDRDALTQWLTYMGVQLAASWHRVWRFETQAELLPVAPSPEALFGLSPDLDADAEIVVTRFGIALPNRAERLHVVLGLPVRALAGARKELRTFARFALTAELVGPQQQAERPVPPELDLADPFIVLALMRVPPIVLELGSGLAPLVDPDLGGELMERMVRARFAIAMATGFVSPGIQYRENEELLETAYQIEIKGQVVARGKVRPDGRVAIATPRATGPIEGDPVVLPGLPGASAWVSRAEATRAERLGYRIEDATGVVAAHLKDVIQTQAAEILSLEEVRLMLEKAGERAPTGVGLLDLKPGTVHRVLQHLLRGHMTIRNLEGIVEQLGVFGSQTSDPIALAELVRGALPRDAVGHLARDHKVAAIALSPGAHAGLEAAARQDALGARLELPAWQAAALAKAVRAACEAAKIEPPVVVCEASVRPHLQAFFWEHLPGCRAIAYREVRQPHALSVRATVGWPGLLARFEAWSASEDQAPESAPEATTRPPAKTTRPRAPARTWGEAMPPLPSPPASLPTGDKGDKAASPPTAAMLAHIFSSPFTFLEEIDPEYVVDLFDSMGEQNVAGILGLLTPGYADMVLQLMPPERQEKLINLLQTSPPMPEFQQKKVARLLREKLGLPE